MAEPQRPARKHVLTVENRQRLTATGIGRVDSFSEELITAQTDLGELHIKGQGLHIENLSAETGDLLVTGKIGALSYAEGAPAGSFLGWLFR